MTNLSESGGLIRRRLDRALASKFVQSQLGQGLTLARALEFAQWSEASYSAFLPVEVDEPAAHDFASALGLSPKPAATGSGVVVQPVLRHSSQIAQLLLDELADRSTVGLVEDHISVASDLAGSDAGTNPCWVRHAEELYYALDATRASLPLVERALDRGTSYMAVAMLARMVEPIEFRCEGEISSAALELISDRAFLVVVGAYDREGYVIMERNLVA